MRRVMVTRPTEDSGGIAAALRARGIVPVIAPLLEIVPAPGAAPDLDGAQAVLVTSRNGVRALAAATARRDVALYAVGDATAALARAAGFTRVASAGGNADALAALVRARLSPLDGVLVHAAGAARAGDLAAALAGSGFAVRTAVLYEARPVPSLPAEAARLLEAGALEAALFFSPRTAETFASLADRAGLRAACGRLACLCLSAAVAERLSGIAWRAVRVAARPDADALLALVDACGDDPGRA